MVVLTESQELCLNLIVYFIKENGHAPTRKELAELLKQKSLNGVNQKLRQLEKKGFIEDYMMIAYFTAVPATILLCLYYFPRLPQVLYRLITDATVVPGNSNTTADQRTINGTFNYRFKPIIC